MIKFLNIIKDNINFHKFINNIYRKKKKIIQINQFHILNSHMALKTFLMLQLTLFILLE